MKIDISLSLHEAFDSTFHGNLDFNDFLNIDIENEFKIINFKNGNSAFSSTKKLRKYHKFLNSFVFNFVKINKNVVFSYREGKNAFDAVEQHSKSKYFFQTDIEDFFNSITIADVEKIFDDNLYDSPIKDLQEHKKSLLNLILIDNNLPIGFSTSPNISNSFLYEFDNVLEAYCLTNNITYTRFADDLILSSKDKNNLDTIQVFINDTFVKLFDNRISLNLNKTRFTHEGRKIKLLGMTLLPSGKITVDKALRKELEVLLHFYVTDKAKFNAYLEKVYNNKLSKISGKLNYINTVDQNYLNKLRRKYGNYVIDGFCHQTIN